MMTWILSMVAAFYAGVVLTLLALSLGKAARAGDDARQELRDINRQDDSADQLPTSVIL